MSHFSGDDAEKQLIDILEDTMKSDFLRHLRDTLKSLVPRFKRPLEANRILNLRKVQKLKSPLLLPKTIYCKIDEGKDLVADEEYQNILLHDGEVVGEYQLKQIHKINKNALEKI